MATPWFDIRSFAPLGMLADGSTDWSPIFRKAIDHLNGLRLDEDPLLSVSWNPRPAGNAGTLYVPRGIYRIGSPILIARRSPEGDRFLPCSLSIVGEAPSSPGDPASGSCIWMAPESRPIMSSPAVILQGARHVQLRNLLILGQNAWISEQATDDEVLLRHWINERVPWRDPYRVSDEVRDNPASPYAGVCIDPFHPILLEVGNNLGSPYPDLRDLYLPGPSSQNVLIENCQIRRFTVGVCLSPSYGLFADNHRTDPALTIANSTIEITKSSLSMGQGRRAHLHGVRLRMAKFAINCADYGGPGPCPSILGAHVRGVKQVFLAPTVGNSAAINDLSAQRVLSLGQLGSPSSGGPPRIDTYHFTSCSFTFDNPQDLAPSRPATNAHLFNFARATFTGCAFRTGRRTAGAMDPPIHLANHGFLTLDRCALGIEKADAPDPADDLGSPFWVTGATDQVDYHSCVLLDGPLATETRGFSTLSDMQGARGFQGPAYLVHSVLPGALFSSQLVLGRPEAALAPAPGFRFVAGSLARVLIGLYGLATLALGDDGTASFLAPGGLLRPGDLVATSEALPGVLSPNHPGFPLVLGRVAKTTPAQDPQTGQPQAHVVLSFVPIGLRGALAALRAEEVETIPLYLVYLRRTHPLTQGQVSMGSEIIDKVTIQETDRMGRPVLSLEQAWARGHRIRGPGIAEGTYVEQVDPMAGTLRISRKVTFPGGQVELFDADVRRIQMRAL
jgi:hypothetical protein